jgi:hypothetical protein
MADKFGNEQCSYNILIPDVSLVEFNKFRDWLDCQSFHGGIGWVLYPQDRKNGKFILTVDHGSFGGTWWREALPGIIELFGEERLIYAVEE